MWWRLCAEGNFNALRFLHRLKSLWGERFQDMKIFMQKTLWVSFFPQWMPPLLAGFLHTPGLVGHWARASSHSSAPRWTHLRGSFHFPARAKKPPWQLRHSVRDPARDFLTPGRAEGGLCWVLWLVEQYKAMGVQGRIKANGLQLSASLWRQLQSNQMY